MKGVCDTPLHLFGYFMGNMMVERRAFPRREGRMRYAPTFVGWRT